MSTYSFPKDLRDAQIALHQAHAALEHCAAGLPWSAAPMPGWQAEKPLHSGYRSEKADSPGYASEQREEVARLRKQMLDLGILVSTHPFWATVDMSEVVQARVALKHTHETVAADRAP